MTDNKNPLTDDGFKPIWARAAEAVDEAERAKGALRLSDFGAPSYLDTPPDPVAHMFADVTPPDPVRVSILNEGAHITAGDRQRDYGDPEPNFRLCGGLKKLLRDSATRDISAAEWHAIDEICTKLGRIVVGRVKRDNYVDGATYFAIAGEMALKNTPE